MTGASQSGLLQSIRMDFKDAQSAEFDVTFFDMKPATAITDKATPAVSTADALLAQPTLRLTNPSTVLGSNSTVYGMDGIARALTLNGTASLYAVVTTTGTPTFGSATDMQLCASVIRDN